MTFSCYKFCWITSKCQSTETTLRKAFTGSCLSHQLPESKSDGTINLVHDGSEFSALPRATHDFTCTYNVVLTENEHLFIESLKVSQSQTEEIEQITRKQSDCPEWHTLRQRRLTLSTLKDIIIKKRTLKLNRPCDFKQKGVETSLETWH